MNTYNDLNGLQEPAVLSNNFWVTVMCPFDLINTVSSNPNPELTKQKSRKVLLPENLAILTISCSLLSYKLYWEQV